MSRPNAKMRVTKKDGITFESNIDHAKYLIEELIDAANRDVGKLIRKRVGEELIATYKTKYVKGSISEDRRKDFKPSYARKALQYWARRRDHDLIVGFKHYSWYGTHQELGDHNYPKLGILRNTVAEMVPDIRRVQAQYLTALNDKNPSEPTKAEEMSSD